jgi:hypothetical protein
MNIEDIPRDPEAAFRIILTKLLTLSEPLPSGKPLSPNIKTSAVSMIRMLETISPRLTNGNDYLDSLHHAHSSANNSDGSLIKIQVKEIEKLFIANTFDSHFVDQKDEDNFNNLDWNKDDRSSVLGALSQVRSLVQSSPNINDEHRQRIIYWVAKAENETYSAHGKIVTILGAVDQVMDCVGRSGEKLQSFVKIIETIRTSTRRNVSVPALEGPEKQKKLPPPDKNEPVVD